MERLASLVGFLVTCGRYLFLFLLYRFLWQLFQATKLEVEEETSDEIFLVVTDLSDPDKSYSYPFRGELTVGRDRTNQVIIRDPYAQERHLRLWQVREQFFVEDLNTTFGTLLDGGPLVGGEAVEVRLGEKIMIGTTQLSLQKAEARSPDRGGE